MVRSDFSVRKKSNKHDKIPLSAGTGSQIALIPLVYVVHTEEIVHHFHENPLIGLLFLKEIRFQVFHCLLIFNISEIINKLI